MSKPLFTRDNFSAAPGGQIYEWKEVETKFEIPADGIFVIEIIASAKNAKQNNSTDDDDLRVSLDGFDFGKYEIHDEKVSWKGFGTAASFDGANLQGGTKTVYFFVELKKGEHILKFFADEKPVLKKIEILEIKDKKFELDELSPPENIPSNRKGIPWTSFVFLGVKPKNFGITANCKSAAQKKSTDGDNLKVAVNGKILPNKKAPTSDKYKNFYFSGDLDQGKSEVLNLQPADFKFFEDSIELWYDESPSFFMSIEFFEEVGSWLEKVGDAEKNAYYKSFATAIALDFRIIGWKYSSQFLFHSLKNSQKNLTFESDDPIVEKIKSDPIYEKIVEKLKEKISSGILSGELWSNEFDGGINFNSWDLKYAIHGIHKIEFAATEKSAGKFEVDFTIFDVYDFDKMKYGLRQFYKCPYILMNNQIDDGELAGVVKNFEVKIKINGEIK